MKGSEWRRRHTDVFGPSDPRTRRRTSLLSQSPRPGSVVCARRCALPPAVSPLGRAPCSVALPSLARLSSPSRSALDRWLLGEERARRMARQSDEYSARNRCYSTQPQSTTIEESRITRMQKGTITKGRPPFCHLQCNAHRGPSACCALSTQYPVNHVCPHDLAKI